MKEWDLPLQPIVKTLSRGGEEGLKECILKAQEDLESRAAADQNRLLEEFYANLQESPDSLVVGKEVWEMHEQGALRAIYTTRGPEDLGLDLGREGAEAKGKGKQKEREREGVPDLGFLLSNGASLYVLSTASELGTRFEKDFGGLAAFTWF